MSKIVREISVFVSSPSDQSAQRQLVKEICEAISLGRGRREGFTIQTILWETHASPGAGPEPQAIINKQLGDEYDIFVGIMGNRFGTKTSHAGSGTEEEFDRAYSRYQRQKDLEILFYFQDSKSAAGEIIGREIVKREAFQEKLKGAGVFYWPFSDIESFRTNFDRHISESISNCLAINLGTNSEIARTSPAGQSNSSFNPLENFSLLDESSDDGLEDLTEIAGSSIEQFTVEMGLLTEGVANLGRDFGTLQVQSEKVISQGPKAVELNRARLIRMTTKSLDEYARVLVISLPKMHSHIEKGLDATQKAVDIIIEDMAPRDGSFNSFLSSLQDFEYSLEGCESVIVDFQGQLSTFPRLSKTMNQSKRKVVLLQKDLLAFFQQIRTKLKKLMVDASNSL